MISRSWYFPILYVISYLYYLIGTLVIPSLQMPLILVTKVLAAITGFILLFSFPLLAIFLYRDAKAIKTADREWEPKPIHYGILGLAPILAIIPAITFSNIPQVATTDFYAVAVPATTMPVNTQGIIAFCLTLVPWLSVCVVSLPTPAMSRTYVDSCTYRRITIVRTAERLREL